MPTITGETSNQSRLNSDEMGEEGKTSHAMVWHMIIEWFCQLDHTIVGAPLLKALMDYSSFWTGAPKQARERAALRYLEEAMGNPTLPSSAASTSSTNSLSFEDLLLSYLNRKENPNEDIMGLNIEVLGNIMDNKPKLPPPLLDLVLSNYNAPLDEPQPVVGSPSLLDLNQSQPKTQTRIGTQEPVQKQSVVQEQVQEQPVIGSLLDPSQTQPETRTQIETQKQVQKQFEVQKPVQEQHVIGSLSDPSQTQPETQTQIKTQKRVQKQSEVQKQVEEHVIGSLLHPSQTQPETRTQVETQKWVQKQSEVRKQPVIGSLLHPSQTQPETRTQVETQKWVQKQSEVRKQPVIGSLLDPSQTQPETQKRVQKQSEVQKQVQEEHVIVSLLDRSQTQPETQTQEWVQKQSEVQEQSVIGSILDPSQTQPETQTQIETRKQVQKQSEVQEPVIGSLSDPSQTQPETGTQELISDRYPKRKRRTTPTVNEYQAEEKSNKKIPRAANNTGSQLGRRKIIRFTKEEEEILEKGMEKFREEGGEIWIKIREFGNGVFNESRLPMDLKDKWRNMLKNKEKKRKKIKK